MTQKENSIATNRWWDHLTKSYTVRELTLDDFYQLSDLVDNNPYLWKDIELTKEEKHTYLKNFILKVKDTKQRWKCYGAFINGQLIMETSGFFPKKCNYWYSTSLRHRQENNSLFSGNLQRYLFADCFIPLIEYGEQQNKFSFYAMRSASHQKIINRMWARSREDSPLARYEYFIDAFIPANTINEISTYEVFFNRKSYPIDLIVNLHCLKNEYREKILVK